jgi:hypothetical protein
MAVRSGRVVSVVARSLCMKTGATVAWAVGSLARIEELRVTRNAGQRHEP